MDPTQVEDTTMDNGFSEPSASPTGCRYIWARTGCRPMVANRFMRSSAQAGANVRQSQIDFIEPDRLLHARENSVTGLMAKGSRNAT